MAKSKVDYWLTDDGLTLLQGWARDGLTDEQIMHNMGIKSKSTFYSYMKKYPNISNSIKKGKEIVDYEVENALLTSAKSGNVTAQIYWLNNRKPDIWRNKQDKDNNDALKKLDKLLEEQKNA